MHMRVGKLSAVVLAGVFGLAAPQADSAVSNPSCPLPTHLNHSVPQGLIIDRRKEILLLFESHFAKKG